MGSFIKICFFPFSCSVVVPKRDFEGILLLKSQQSICSLFQSNFNHFYFEVFRYGTKQTTKINFEKSQKRNNKDKVLFLHKIP